MPDAPLLASKKCPHCQQWSVWQQRSDDLCQHCGQLLDPRAHHSAQAREEAEKQQMPAIMLIEIKPDDGPVVRFFKKIIRGGQLAFAAIITFIVWVATVVVG